MSRATGGTAPSARAGRRTRPTRGCCGSPASPATQAMQTGCCGMRIRRPSPRGSRRPSSRRRRRAAARRRKRLLRQHALGRGPRGRLWRASEDLRREDIVDGMRDRFVVFVPPLGRAGVVLRVHLAACCTGQCNERETHANPHAPAAARSVWVYFSRGAANNASASPSSTIAPSFITSTRCDIARTTARSWLMNT